VVDGVDRDARHADIAFDTRVIGIVAAVGGEVEGDGEALLPSREVAAIEGVRLLGRGEARVLTDGPRLGDVHGRVGAAQIRRNARQAVNEVEAGDVLGRVGWFDYDTLRCVPDRRRFGARSR